VLTTAKENFTKHTKAVVGGPFKSGLFHKTFFDRNPYLTEKDGAVYRNVSKSANDIKQVPFKPSHPGKKLLGNKDGAFSKYPAYSSEKYVANNDFKPEKRVVNNTGKLFTPQPWGKSKPQTSVINYNVGIKVNSTNFKTAANSYSTYNLRSISAC
jgi:hypothetical protein